MINKLNEYRVEIFKIAGFGLMAPIGRVIIEPVVVFNEFGPLLFIGFLILYLLMALFGLILIFRGYDILDEYGK